MLEHQLSCRLWRLRDKTGPGLAGPTDMLLQLVRAVAFDDGVDPREKARCPCQRCT